MENNTTQQSKFIDTALFVRLIKLATPFKQTFALATLFAIALAIVIPLRPYLIQRTIDDAIMNSDAQLLTTFILLLILALVTNVILSYFFIYMTNWLGQSIIKDLRVRIFKHIISLKLRYFDTTPIGTSTTRTINDVETINSVFSQGLITIIADLLTIFSIMAIMFYSDWRLTLVVLTVFPILIYSTYVFKEAIKKSYDKVRTQVARLNAFLQEHISGMYVIQVFAAEEKELNKFKEINDLHRKANIDSIWAYSIFFPVMEIITAVALALVVWFGANRVVQETTTLGVLIAFIMYLSMLFRPLRMMADKFNVIQMGMIAAERIFKILDTDATIPDKGAIKVNNLKGDIVFDDVWMAYDETNYILKGVSFKLKAGESLAIVGPTGAGKSSIINILNRFYPIQKGKISIDGIDIKDYTLSSLRNRIGLVLQDVFLFSGTVLDNITLRNSEISVEKVAKAAREIGASTFIEQLPGKYNYNVMERGAMLSTGQRQLISFIRTFVYQPDILVLDEATSSVDTESERMIQNATDHLVKNKTSIIIAHRLSTIKNADKIIVLDKGEIVEMGTHNELLNKNGHYKKLHDMQFSKTKAA